VGWMKKKVLAMFFLFFFPDGKKKSKILRLPDPLHFFVINLCSTVLPFFSFHQKTTKLSQLSSSPREQISFVSWILEKNKKWETALTVILPKLPLPEWKE